MAETASAQVSAAVQVALAPAARYIALVIQTNPLGSADQLLARPDIDAMLIAALEQARLAAAAVVRQEWDAAGAPDAPVLAHLLADIGRQYGSLAHLRHLIRTAHASVPQRRFVRGVTPPGASPAIEAGNERARAVRDAILGFARQAALRSHLTVVVAAAAARTTVVLAEGHARRAAGEKVLKRWEARRDGKACHWCRNLDGVTIGLDESFLPYLGGPADLTGHGHLTQPPKPYRGALQGPGLHPHCLPGDSLVAVERATGATARIYHGELVVLRTLSDKLLRVTPNHPVLTDHGWVAGGLLEEGDYVVSARGDEWKDFGGYHDNGVPATIQQVAEAILGSGSVTTAEVPVSAEDFHGDGAGSEVCVVGSDGSLPPEFDLSLAEHVSEHQFQRADVGRELFVAQRCPAFLVPAHHLPAPGSVGGSGSRAALLGSGAGCIDDVLLADAAELDASIQEASLNGVFGDAKAARDCLERLAGQIALDKIVSVQREMFSGHVYNLQTPGGWYIGNGIVVHNCGQRCHLAIVTEAEHAREPKPAAVPAAPVFITAAAIRAMPELRYRGLVAFLEAALHELGQVLSRLRRGAAGVSGRIT